MEALCHHQVVLQEVTMVTEVKADREARVMMDQAVHHFQLTQMEALCHLQVVHREAKAAWENKEDIPKFNILSHPPF